MPRIIRTVLSPRAARGVCLPLVAVCVSLAVATGAAAARPHLAERTILRIARTAAVRAGDQAPTQIQHVAGTRTAIGRAAPSATGGAGAWSYLIAERGHFILNSSRVVPGRRLPTGTVLTLVVNARTDVITSVAVGHRYPNLARVGSVVTDLRARPRRHGVLVPNTTGLGLAAAYARARAFGLRVTIAQSFKAGSLECHEAVVGQLPAPGNRVPAGTAIALTGAEPPCGAGSPAVPVGPPPTYVVPQFVGEHLSAAIAWVQEHQLYWDAGTLAPIARGSGATLYDNYVITSQSPPAGSSLSLGVGFHYRNTGSFEPTPLQLQTIPHA